MAPCLELFAFRYRDPRTGKWVRGRYLAKWDEIASRYAEWEIIGPADIRDVDPDARAFTPHESSLEVCSVPGVGNSNGLQPWGGAAGESVRRVADRRYVEKS